MSEPVLESLLNLFLPVQAVGVPEDGDPTPTDGSWDQFVLVNLLPAKKRTFAGHHLPFVQSMGPVLWLLR